MAKLLKEQFLSEENLNHLNRIEYFWSKGKNVQINNVDRQYNDREDESSAKVENLSS